MSNTDEEKETPVVQWTWFGREKHTVRVSLEDTKLLRLMGITNLPLTNTESLDIAAEVLRRADVYPFATELAWRIFQASVITDNYRSTDLKNKIYYNASLRILIPFIKRLMGEPFVPTRKDNPRTGCNTKTTGKSIELFIVRLQIPTGKK